MSRYLDATEWLDSIWRGAGDDADWAREAIDQLEMAQDAESELCEWAEQLGDRDEAYAELEKYQELTDEIESIVQQNDMIDGDSEIDKLRNGLAGLTLQAEKYWEIRELCKDAGFVQYSDDDSDLIPLLRMFLPEG